MRWTQWSNLQKKNRTVNAVIKEEEMKKVKDMSAAFSKYIKYSRKIEESNEYDDPE